VSNAPSKPVSFSRPKVGYFSNRPRIYVNTHRCIIYTHIGARGWCAGFVLAHPHLLKAVICFNVIVFYAVNLKYNVAF